MLMEVRNFAMNPSAGAGAEFDKDKSALVSPTRKRDWSRMIDDIIRMIELKVAVYPDMDRFGATCKDWYRIKKEVLGGFPMKYPLMLLPYDSQKDIFVFVHRDSQSVAMPLYEWQLPCAVDWYHSTCNGWIVTTDKHLNLSLIDPIMRTHVPLPRPHLAVEDHLEAMTWDAPKSALLCYRNNFLQKVVIPQTPCQLSPKCAMAGILTHFRRLYVCRLGDEEWTRVDVGPRYDMHFQDVVFFKGNIYAFGNCSDVAVVNYDGASVPTTRYITGPEQRRVGTLQAFTIYYLVDNCDDMLLVAREYKPFHRPCETINFKIYRLVEMNETWTRVHNLGRRSFFLGQNSSFSVCAMDNIGFRTNCIYFTDNNHEEQGNFEHGYQWDNGVCSASKMEQWKDLLISIQYPSGIPRLIGFYRHPQFTKT